MADWKTKLPKGTKYRQCTSCQWRGMTTNMTKEYGRCPACGKMTYKLHVIK